MTNPSSKQAITSLLTEHLRYTPLTLLDDIINTVNDLVYRAVTAVEEGLTEASGSQLGFADRAAEENTSPEKDEDGNDVYPAAKLEIEYGVHQLQTLLDATIDKNFDKLEIYVLRNILTVPEDLAPYVRLGHYEDLDFTSSTSAPSPESLFLLRRKAQEAQKLHNALVAESSRNAALISQLRSILFADPQSPTADPSSPSYAFLASTLGAKILGVEYHTEPPSTSPPPGQDRQPLTTHTRFALDQLPALRTLLAQLRPQLAALQQGSAAAGRRNPAEEERRDYLESRTRKVLERGGVDVESGDGLVVHGFDGQGGRRVGPEEVSGLERVANALERQHERGNH